VEYTWALAKLCYCNAPINRKRRKESFGELVDKCLCTERNLQLEKVRKCSRRARDYMVAYKAIEELQGQKKTKQTTCNSVTTDNKPCFEVNYHLIEKVMKMYKTHRNS
jgi:hypothetical protein